MEERVVQGFATHLGGFDIDLQVRDDFPLSGEIVQFLRADYSVQFIIFAVGCAARVEIAHGGQVCSKYKYSIYLLKY